MNIVTNNKIFDIVINYFLNDNLTVEKLDL